MRWVLLIAVCAAEVFAQGKAAAKAKARVTVPFVGCAAGGVTGPFPAPKGRMVTVPFSRPVAAQVAYYGGLGSGAVLGPRGWHCLEIRTENDVILLVGPQPIDWEHRSAFSSFGIVERDKAADAAAKDFRLLPEVYASDTLTHKSDFVVEFVTPSNAEGLGTGTWMKKAPTGPPIRGVVLMVGEGTDLLQLSVRLPKEMDALERLIIAQFERDHP